MVMVFNGLAYGLLETIGFGWPCTFLMIVCLYAWKGDFKSSYNFRPKWAKIDIPEEVATKIDKEAAKWLFYSGCAFWCSMIIGWAYSIIFSDYDNLPFILLAVLILWTLILLAGIIVFLMYTWSLEKKLKLAR